MSSPRSAGRSTIRATSRSGSGPPSARSRAARGHEISDHTADAAIRAWAATLPGLFEEAAAALSELTVEIGEGVRPAAWTVVELAGHDLDALAYGWLNELIGCAEVERRAIAVAAVGELRRPGAHETPDGWRLRARVGLVAYEAGRVDALRHVKAVTLHGLRVGERDDGWSMDAVVDL